MPAARATSALTVLMWSPRVAPGLLSAAAWDSLRGADAVLAANSSHPLAPALADAGVLVRPLDLAPWSDAAAASRLTDLARDSHVVWLADASGDESLRAALGDPAVVVGSFDLPGARVLDLVAVMDRLRSPGGCGWDAEQTHASLVTYLVEETYETVEAIETGDLVGLREELGDLLLQVAFHARIGEEHTSDAWSIDDVADGITAKLVRRHPHVFGTEPVAAGSVEELEGRWDRQKAQEKGRTSAVDGVPLGQPALSLVSKLHGRASRAGLEPELPLVDRTVTPTDEDVLGDLLLAIAIDARAAGLDPEAALRAAARRYVEAIKRAES